MDVAANILDALKKSLVSAGVEHPDPKIEFPAEFVHGDFATNAGLVYGKQLGKNPKMFADEIVAALGEIEGVSKIEVAGPGFINFHLVPEYFSTLPVYISPREWGKGSARSEQVVVEYTDPNPFKAFHIGHLMSNTIGESLARLIENTGAKVVRANYQGDLGVHVASAIWGMRMLGLDPKSADDFGRAYAAGATAYKEDEAAKKEIDEINKKLYDRSDLELGAIYDTGRTASLDAFERIYAMLGTKFDRYFFESETGSVGKEIVTAHPDIFPESDGARVFKGEEYGLHTRVFINAQGLPTYEAKELGLETMKAKEYPDATQFIVVTGNEIIDYFKVIRKVLELIEPKTAARLIHVPHGMMRLPSGKMSSRTGNVITGESLLHDLEEAARERARESRADDIDTLARVIAVGAIKYQILRQAVSRDIVFDEAQALSLEGNSGPYIQYAHARACALLARGREAGVSPAARVGEQVSIVERLIARFPHIAARAASELAPQHIATFLIELSSAFNAWYAQEQILDGTDNAPRKLAIVAAVATTLKNGLHLLGIEAPEKM
ncbi:MAG: arginine--tRNA ligase [Parcubacteria group bacterium]|nr:arginine--tRNA ligase [Parcubacteria group bacterium]